MSRVSLSCDYESASRSSFNGLTGTLGHEFSLSGRGWNVRKTTNFRGFRDFSFSELPKGLILAKKLRMWIKGNPFLFEINVGKSRIRHRTTMNSNDIILNQFWVDRVVHHWILESLYVGSVSFRHWFLKMKWLGFELPLLLLLCLWKYLWFIFDDLTVYNTVE